MRPLAVALVLFATPAAAQLAGTTAAQIQQQQQMQQMQVQQGLQNQQLQIQFQLQQQQQQMQRELQYGAQRPPTLHEDAGIAGPRYIVNRRPAQAARVRPVARRAGTSHPKRRLKRRR